MDASDGAGWFIAPKAHFRRELGSSPVVENQGVTVGYIYRFMVLFEHRIKNDPDTGSFYKLKFGWT